MYVAFCGNLNHVNATPIPARVVARLVQFGFSASLLARVAGVNRSSAVRWIRGSEPRPPAQRRLERAEALLGVAAPSSPDIRDWFDQRNPDLAGLSPAEWLAKDRDVETLAAILRPVDRKPTAPRRRAGNAFPLAGAILDFQRAADMIAGVNLAPILDSMRFIEGLDRQAAMIADLSRAQLLVQATGIAQEMARLSETWSEMIRAPLMVYREAFAALPASQVFAAFEGMGETIRGLDQPIIRMQSGLIAQLVADHNTGLGALGAAMDLQLGSVFSAAVNAHAHVLTEPYVRETFAWRAWLPTHPEALVRLPTLKPEWLAGQAHVATRASVAALSPQRSGWEAEEVGAALAGVTRDPPDLLSMTVPGTEATLREMIRKVAPAAVEPLEGGWHRVWDGGTDATRQGAASLRAALDEVANALAPGPKKDREQGYLAVLQIQPGDPTTRLLTLQVSLLYTTYQPLSDAVHDEGGIEALQALALGILSCLAGILARLEQLRLRSQP
jgi:hypothetical protein